jgi:NAD(P)-dependent dehydrogenase (short-subunit alcohol dehydrogenase family)
MISSVASMANNANGTPYNMGKAALESLAFTLAKEEQPHGIHVNVVAPGVVETEMGRRLVKAVAGVTDLRAIDEIMPYGRVCQPEDVANVVRFFCSDKASYLTGERLYVWGGGQDWRAAGEAAKATQ